MSIKTKFPPRLLITSETDEDVIEHLNIDDKILELISQCPCEKDCSTNPTVDIKNDRHSFLIVSDHMISEEKLKDLIKPILYNESFSHDEISVRLSEVKEYRY